MSDISQELAGFAIQTRWEDLPASVVHETKLLLIDSIGCALAALSTDKGKMSLALARRFGGPPESSIIGTGDKVSCSSAALANGELIITVDYDALMPGGHAPPYVIPAPLAVAETAGVSGKELILAIAVGFEVAARVSSALRFSYFAPDGSFRWAERQGYAPCNFGAAAGAGRILNLDREQMVNALGIAGHLCQVLTHTRFSYSGHRHMTKYGVPGWQSTGAISAALLAQMGYMGDTTIFDPENGFWKFAGFESWHPESILDGIGRAWQFTNVHYKPYPCCRMLHAALDCFLRIIGPNSLAPGEIKSVRAFLHPTVDEPVFTNDELVNTVDATFNPRYVFSVAAHGVKIGVEWQDAETMKDPEILEFMKKVTFRPNPDFSSRRVEGRIEGTVLVEVAARDRIFREEARYARGTPGTDLQLTDRELTEKFRHNAERILSRTKADKAVDVIFNLEKAGSTAELMKQITL